MKKIGRLQGKQCGSHQAWDWENRHRYNAVLGIDFQMVKDVWRARIVIAFTFCTFWPSKAVDRPWRWTLSESTVAQELAWLMSQLISSLGIRAYFKLQHLCFFCFLQIHEGGRKHSGMQLPGNSRYSPFCSYLFPNAVKWKISGCHEVITDI